MVERRESRGNRKDGEKDQHLTVTILGRGSEKKEE